jgi:NitT/TauT family transport system substrate-binding protein
MKPRTACKEIIMYKLIFIYLFTIQFLLLSGCTVKENHSITIAEASQPVFALIYIAELNGYFKDEGLDVTYKKFTSGRDALNSVINRESDFATVYETPVVLQSFKGHDLGVISSLHKSSKNTYLVARKDKGIVSPMDLKGKKIGVPLKTNGEFFLHQFLLNHGLNINEVQLVNLLPQDTLQSIRKGEVDAVACWNPHIFKIQNSLKEHGTTFFSDVYTEMSVLVGMKNTVKKKEIASKKLLKALVRAQEYLDNNKVKSKKIVKSWLKDVPDEIVDGTWEAFNATLVLDNILLSVLKSEGKWFIEQGMFDSDLPDFDNQIMPKYLYDLNSEFVTIQMNTEK